MRKHLPAVVAGMLLVAVVVLAVRVQSLTTELRSKSGQEANRISRRAELRKKREQLRRLVSQPDRGEAAALTKKITLERIDDRMRRSAKLEDEISVIQIKMDLIKTRAAAPKVTTVAARPVEQAVRQDEEIVGLKKRLAEAERQLKKLAAVSANPMAPSIQRLRQQIGELRDELENKVVLRRAELEEEMTRNDGKAYTLEAFAIELTVKQHALGELKRDIAAAAKEVADIEESDSEIDALRDEIDELKRL